MLLADAADIVGSVSSAVVGIVGVAVGYLATRRSSRAQERQVVEERAHRLDVLRREQEGATERELRNELLTTAAALSGELTSAYFRVVRVPEAQAHETLDGIQGTLESAATHLGRTSLLFGPRSKTTQAAESAYQNIATLLTYQRTRVEHGIEAIASKTFNGEDEWAGKNLAEFKRLAYADAQALTLTPIAARDDVGASDLSSC